MSDAATSLQVETETMPAPGLAPEKPKPKRAPYGRKQMAGLKVVFVPMALTTLFALRMLGWNLDARTDAGSIEIYRYWGYMILALTGFALTALNLVPGGLDAVRSLAGALATGLAARVGKDPG